MPVTSEATGHILRSPHEDQKVEVLFEPADGGERVALRYSTWVEGLGWCAQKTIRVETDQLDELHRALTVARHRVRRQKAAAGVVQEAARVIQMPSFS